MFGNPLLLGDDGYQISRSVRLRSSASAYFNRTPASAGNRRIWTWSGWVKLGALGSANRTILVAGTNTSNLTYLRLSSEYIQALSGVSAIDFQLVTAAVFRDPSAWYHVVYSVDTTNGTASQRLRLFVNGVQITSFITAAYPVQNYETFVNSTVTHRLGGNIDTPVAEFFDGYLTEINFIDGQALTPAAFGETDAVTGVWKPRRYTGTYGTNGFYLNFSDPSAATAAAIGKDYSGNGNNWTPNNISVTAGVTYDSMLDVPTPWADGGNGRGNYCVVNPLDSSGTNTVSNGNLTYATGTTFGLNRCTFAMTAGKWYWEVSNFSGIPGVGVSRTDVAATNAGHTTANGWAYFGDTGNRWNNNSGTAYGATYGGTDVIGVALDMDAGTLAFFKNGVSQGTAFSAGLLGQSLSPILTSGLNSSGGTFNFGQRPFAYTPPTGFRALNTNNLPEPLIVRGNRWMDVVTRTGTGATATVSGYQFQPDLVWIKSRTAARNNVLFDAVRGIAASGLYSNSTGAEDTGFTDGLTAYTSSGFTLGADSLSRGTNVNGDSYVNWAWRESAQAGFDIVTYTGNGANRTIAHSLGVAPSMMIVKRRNGTGTQWAVYHQAIGNTNTIYLNLTNAQASQPAFWNSTTPTSTVFSLGTDATVNGSADIYVAYLFAEVPGFSRFGSYTGNGSTDGPFVFCGFRPRWVMIKRTDSTGNWQIVDTARSAANAMPNILRPNTSDSEGVTDVVDNLANGFKLRIADGFWNASGGTYIFAAFAEAPFKYSLAR